MRTPKVVTVTVTVIVDVIHTVTVTVTVTTFGVLILTQLTVIVDYLAVPFT